MEDHKKLEEQECDYGVALNFEPDKENSVNEREVELTSNILAAKSLANEGYLKDAFDIITKLNDDMSSK